VSIHNINYTKVCDRNLKKVIKKRSVIKK